MYCYQAGDDTTDKLKSHKKDFMQQKWPTFSTYHYSLHVVIIALLLVRDKLFTNRRCPSVLVEAIATQCCCMLKSKAASLNPVQTNIAI